MLFLFAYFMDFHIPYFNNGTYVYEISTITKYFNLFQINLQNFQINLKFLFSM